MVRTKQPRKTRSVRETTDECDALVRDFERQAAQRIHKVEADLTMQMNMLVNSIDVALAGFPPEIRKMTLGELLTLDNEKDATMETTGESEFSSVSKTVEKPRTAKRATAASDDGYATESTTVAKTTRVSRINNVKNSDRPQTRQHRSSSNSANSHKRQLRTTRSVSRGRMSKRPSSADQENRRDLLKAAGRCPTSSKYKTPSLKNQAPMYSVVTPKIKPNTPINIMRRPRQGEMVLSMQGSPLLVSSIVQERTANINVPLQNGDVISVLPNPGFRLSHMPPVDDETMQQLMTLTGHLNKVMGNK